MRILLALLFSVSMFVEAQPQRRFVGPLPANAEMSIKQASEQLAAAKDAVEKNIAVLVHLRTADAALADAMQPENAIQKAFEEVEEAKRICPDFFVEQAIIKMSRELEAARRSPMSADFGRLRSLLHDNALVPASSVVVRDASRLEEETLAWLRVQELISAHVRSLSELASQGLKAAEGARPSRPQ